MKKDINCNTNTYLNWKKDIEEYKFIEGINKKNSDLIVKYIFDMEIGANIAKRSKKGSRGYKRLNVSRRKLIQIAKEFEKRKIKDLISPTEKQLFQWADDLYKGKLKRQDGKAYESPKEFLSTFKAFWHWWMKVNRKEGNVLLDITEDLPMEENENKFVYLTKEQIEQMLPYFNKEEQILIKFLFDSIIRFPTEVASLQAKEIYEKDGEVWVNIPDEIAKTLGRNFNLLYCGEVLLEFIKEKEFKPEDYIFNIIKDNNAVGLFNAKLKKVAVQLFGDKVSHPTAQRKYSEISGYDCRHNGAIHLRQLAQKNNSISLDAIRQRGGWTDFKMLNYYTKFLGLTGEIKKESLLIADDKTRLEKDLEKLKTKVTKKDKDIEIFKKGFNEFLQLLKDTPEAVDLIIKKQGKKKIIDTFEVVNFK